ncbi:MAG: SDR family NAD(P)-dependent oxidoreductase [Bacteroidia bacterium]|nr:MAG: SDR family NAD(P)-dependent oxidoreductase [Bacteroidia bacterium]
MKIKKQALLVGGLGGLGSATTKLLSQNGWHVFAADNKQDILGRFDQTENISPIFMDVTKTDTVEEAYQQISAQTTRLDAVIHVAGILKIGSLAELPVSELEKALDINVLGVYRVNQQFLPMLLPEKGRIIILSSEVARQTAAPFNGIYTISKYALEAYSDALRRELAFLGIKVIKIQPGPFKTNMTKNAEKLFKEAQENSTYFKKNLAKGISYLPWVYKKAHNPVHVAKTILKALESSNPRTAYTVKIDASRMILDWLPVKWADKILGRVLS